jgi:C1A family cysteine protease
METKRIYGWKKAQPDERNFKYAKMAMVKDQQTSLPPSADLSHLIKEVLDQGQLGSCTANAGAQLVRMLLSICNKPDFLPSRLAIYYEERKADGDINEDGGSTITQCFKVLSKIGAFPESEWPYDIEKFKKAPPVASVKEGLNTLIDTYQQLDNTNLEEIKTCLAAGFPIEFGFTVYPGFESPTTAKTGLVPMPTKSQQPLGGHANVIVGYDDNKKVHGHKGAFKCINSWSSQWGLQGFYFIPYSYLTNENLASDFWTARLVS